jgi:multicomponent Na+:H+ antiporter subunit B
MILRTTTLLLMSVLLLFSVFLMLRGHDLPGGGFIGGLMAASAIALYALAYGHAAAVALVRAPARSITAFGLVCALGAGVIGFVTGQTFLTGVWWSVALLDQTIKLSSVLLFDIGVYLVVVGVVLTMLFELEGN